MDTSVSENLQAKQFDRVLQQLEKAGRVAKPAYQSRVLNAASRLLRTPGGLEVLNELAPRIDSAGMFVATDWDKPAQLQPRLVRASLLGDSNFTTIEALNELRFLAIAEGRLTREDISAEEAREFLTNVLALNIDLLFDRGTEASRAAEQPSHRHVVRDLVTYLADRLQASEIYNQVVAEIEAILRQRPIQVEDVKAMITHLSKAQSQGAPLEGIASDKANRLAAALYAPSPLSAGDPGIASYQAQIEAAEWEAIRNEARACASLMHETGLVSAYQAVLVRHLAHHDPDMLPDALGLSDLGRQSYLCYRELTLALIENGVFPEYPQGVFGLTGILERGVLFFQPVAPALWRHLSLKIRPEVAEKISVVFGPSPSPEAHLLAGIMCVLGQPLGVGQGNNPTCQSARAITLYAQNGPDYLLQLLCWAVRDGEIVMTFEGDAISSGELSAGLAQVLDMALDPVSLVLVPHLDRIYAEMGRRTIGRPGDGHAWINPEFHGWWNNRGCRLLIDIGSGAVFDFDGFVRHFYATYHPFFNGSQPVIHGQPAGIAATTSTGDHIGWHAISIQRVALDPEGEMRVYFHDPNNEGRQDWGGDVETSTEGHGEIPGESSLPVAHFASRLYLFHYDPLEEGDPTSVPAEDVEEVAELARKSWAGQRDWI